MPERFTHGMNADVFMDDEGLVTRVDRLDSVNLAMVTFLDLKIASLLFPNHFIEIIGMELIKTSAKLENLEAFHVERRIKSKLAPIPPEHAIFTKHLKENLNFFLRGLICDCAVCQAHNNLHNLQLEENINIDRAAWEIRNAGIYVPTDDPTDYCLGPKGVIFFEVDLVIPSQLRNYIHSLNSREIADQTENLLHFQQELRFGASLKESLERANLEYSDLNITLQTLEV